MPKKKKEPDFEEKLEQKSQDVFASLSPEEVEELSKVLFPDTHTDVVDLLGKERKLRPLPISYSKQVAAISDPLANQMQAAFESDEVHQFEEPTIEALIAIAKILIEFYDWEDLTAADISKTLALGDLQSLAVVQANLNGKNDFLLAGLRIAVQTMRLTEVLTIKFQNLFTMQPSLSSGDVLSQNLSQDIPAVS